MTEGPSHAGPGVAGGGRGAGLWRVVVLAFLAPVFGGVGRELAAGAGVPRAVGLAAGGLVACLLIYPLALRGEAVPPGAPFRPLLGECYTFARWAGVATLLMVLLSALVAVVDALVREARG